MKNKLGFLDFSHTKEKQPIDDEPLDVDLLIKEILKFGNETANRDKGKSKSKKVDKDIRSCQEITQSKNENTDSHISDPLPNNSKENKAVNNQSTPGAKEVSKSHEQKSKRMVRYLILQYF